jgi:ankyrin repeat protein
MQGEQGFQMFKGFVMAGVRPMMEKMLERGVDINRKDEDGKTILQVAAGRFNEDAVRWLLNIPGIDKTGAVEEVETVIAGMIERATSDEKKKNLRKDADDMIAILKGEDVTKGGYRRRKKTRVRSRRIRKTRRASRSK